jgi:NAD(P)-dependent dehydrogenase (short-subunit alcohol dehydrogenase family)
VDVLVNNAGISLISLAEESALADRRRVLEVNLTGPFLMCREFGKGMLHRGSGSIVNLSSVAGLLGVADRAAYNASKHGLVGLTRTLAAEWGGRGVRVNAVCPVWVKTEMDVALSPPERLGEFFGLFSLAGRYSAILGPALTAILLVVFGRGAPAYRISVGSLALIIGLGIFFLSRVPDARPDMTVDEYAPLVHGERTGTV